jgi:cytochrome c oxidase subunit 3
MRMHMGADWRPLPVPFLLWPNTAVLIASSLALHRAQLAARDGSMDRARGALLLGGGLALLFLAGQLLAWRQLDAAGYFVAANPANSFFYLLTAVHGLHVLGGLVALSRAAARLWRRDDPDRVRLSVELCAIYWHFLLFVWLVLFALLLHH